MNPNDRMIEYGLSCTCANLSFGINFKPLFISSEIIL